MVTLVGGPPFAAVSLCGPSAELSGSKVMCHAALFHLKTSATTAVRQADFRGWGLLGGGMQQFARHVYRALPMVARALRALGESRFPAPHSHFPLQYWLWRAGRLPLPRDLLGTRGSPVQDSGWRWHATTIHRRRQIRGAVRYERQEGLAGIIRYHGSSQTSLLTALDVCLFSFEQNLFRDI